MPDFACIPSKTLIRPTTAVAEAGYVAGVVRPVITWEQVAVYRDEIIRHLDDSRQVQGYADQGITFIRGEVSLSGPGRVEGAGRTLHAPHVIVATGSDPRLPSIDGLQEADYWTNREATTFERVPESIVILGGSAQGIELGQMLRRYGAEVTIVQHATHLLDREEPEVGNLVADQLRAEGVDVRLGREAIRVARDTDGERIAHLDDGTEVHGQELLVATGRTLRTQGLKLEAVGATVTRRGVQVDDSCRAGSVGDRGRDGRGPVHLCGQVPGPHRCRRHPRSPSSRELRSGPTGRLLRSRGGRDRPDSCTGTRTGSGCGDSNGRSV